MTTTCAVASGAILSKNLVEQIHITGLPLTVDSSFVFDTLEDLVEYIKKDETKVLDGFDRLVILDGAFNDSYTEKQKAISFLMLQSLMKVLGYEKVELVLLTRNSELRESIKENNANLYTFCYSNTEVFISKKVGLKLLTRVMLGDCRGSGLKNEG